MKSTNNPQIEDLIRSIEILSESLLHCVVPIFRNGKSGRPESCGTGVLIECSTGTFVISAAHVFDQLNSNINLFIYGGKNIIHDLAGSIRLTIPPDGKNRKLDRLDIGVLKLEGNALPPYTQINKRALPIAALVGSAQPREGKQYLITGFPGSKRRIYPVRAKLKSAPYGNLMQSACQTAYEQLGCSVDCHIVMPFDRKKVIGKNGALHFFPNPEGMSGSPVWLLYDDIGKNDPEKTPIVGIFIEYYRQNKLVVATDIRVAIDMIRRAF